MKYICDICGYIYDEETGDAYTMKNTNAWLLRSMNKK